MTTFDKDAAPKIKPAKTRLTRKIRGPKIAKKKAV